MYNRTAAKQAKINLACMAITFGISVLSGLFAGFIASRLPHPQRLFDDSVHFHEVEFGDDTSKYNTGHAEAGHAEAGEVELKQH
jgi:hypothetical protein